MKKILITFNALLIATALSNMALAQPENNQAQTQAPQEHQFAAEKQTLENQEQPKNTQPPIGKENKMNEVKNPEGRFLNMDSNKDGDISKAEFLSFHELRFNQIDTNKDGKISREEGRSAREKMHDRRTDRFKQERQEKYDNRAGANNNENMPKNDNEPNGLTPTGSPEAKTPASGSPVTPAEEKKP